MNQMVKPIVVLLLICVISSGLLGATYSATEETIAAVTKAASDAAMQEVLPGSSAFTEITGGKVAELQKAVETDKVGLIMAAKEDGGLGYVFKVRDKGFGGAYDIMVGIDNDGKVTGAKLLDNSETPGLGSKTGAADFTDRFKGVDAAGLEGVETITGATISSKAFKRCVDTAFQAYEVVGEGA